MGSFTDRNILVTGAGAGIGRAVARALALEGASVILLDRQSRAIESLYDEIESEGGTQPALYPMDLLGAKHQDYLDLAERVSENFGVLHGLLHNAGYIGFLSRIDDLDAELWFRALQVNLNAPFLLTQACLPLLREADAATIVFTSDAVGRQGKAYWGAYAASKAALENFSQVLADELRDSTAIRVNTIDPGPVRTSFRAHAYPAENPQSIKPPESVAPLFLWALGPDSEPVTGQALSFDDMPHLP